MKTLSDFIINKPIDIRRCSFWSLSRQARLRLFTVSGEHLRSLRRRSERIFHSIELRAVMGSAELKLGNYWNETGWNLSPRYNESLWIAFNFTSNVAHKSETESGWWISRAINFHCDRLLMRSRTVEMWVNCISIWDNHSVKIAARVTFWKLNYGKHKAVSAAIFKYQLKFDVNP